MLANLENSAGVTGLEKVIFHSNPKERKFERMLRLPHNCTHLMKMKKLIQSAKTRPGADCGSDHQLLIAKFRLKLKKGGKTTRPFTYDLNQIFYDYTVEMRNRFKGLDKSLLMKVKEEE